MSVYLNFLMKFSFVFAFLAFITVLIYAYLLEVKRDETAENKVFQENYIADMGGKEKIVTTPLNQPHRTDEEVKSWITMTVSEAMTLNPTTIEATNVKIKPNFTQNGFSQYEDYLKNTNILESLRQNRNRMSIFTEDEPLLISKGLAGNNYSWLYQLPVTVSFMPLSQGRNSDLWAEGLNRKIMLRLQVRRATIDENPQELMIESFNATGRR